MNIPYTPEEKAMFIDVVKQHDGNIALAMRVLKSKGVDVPYSSILKIWNNSGFKFKFKKKNNDSKFDVAAKKEAVKLLQLCDYDYKRTVELLEKEKGMFINTKILRGWDKLHGINLAQKNRFADVVESMTEKFADEHEKLAKKIYLTKGLIITRLTELIPKETNMDKLANLFNILSQVEKASPGDDKPLTLISQYNQYIIDKTKNENSKSKHKGDVQDVTPEPV
jgi:hypothetical protein